MITIYIVELQGTNSVTNKEIRGQGHIPEG